MPRRRRSRPRPFPRSWKAATSSASRRPAPARPRPSLCRCCSAWHPPSAAPRRVSRAVIFGGVSQGPQVKALSRGVDVLVATPGRLLDLVQQGHLRLDALEAFVLDEADRMLDMGFIEPVRRIVKMLPAQRQTLL